MAEEKPGLRDRFQINNMLIRETLAEFIGTFIFVSFGCASIAQVVLSRGEFGTTLNINWGWGFGIALGVQWAFNISGAHLNPAISLIMGILRVVNWKRVLLFTCAQILGAFVAAGCIYGIYLESINNLDGGKRSVLGVNATANIFATYPQEHVTLGGGLADQIFGTMMLASCILAIIDPDNYRPTKGLEPLLIGIVVFTLGNTFSFNCGGALNPARDLGPRLFTYMVGYGREVWTPRGIHWWWVPIVGPYLGSILGGVLYATFVGYHIKRAPNHELYVEEENAGSAKTEAPVSTEPSDVTFEHLGVGDSITTIHTGTHHQNKESGIVNPVYHGNPVY
ncbi:aquaporin-3-like [Ptychodera flava]|uniref:aquaporin-3-like n=1 Tax=Ptychodera flava TaxID=63121 RepID=UPI00396A6CAC